MVMWRWICSERNILICLYLTIFLLPLSSWLFYFALVPAALLSMGDIFLTKRKVNYGGKWGWFGGGFLICSLLSVSGAADFFFLFLLVLSASGVCVSLCAYFYIPCGRG